MVKVKLSSACRRPLAVIKYPVEAFLTDDLDTTTVLGVSGTLAKGSNDLLAHSGLA